MSGLRSRWFAALVLALALLAAACTGGDDAGATADRLTLDSGDDIGEPAAAEEAPAEFAAPSEDLAADFDEAGGEQALAGSPPVAVPALQAVDIGRDIIFTGDLTVAVSDVAASSTEANRIVEGLGGFLFGQQSSGSPDPRSTLTFKVPPDRFQEALRQLGELGELRVQNVSAEDVTERVVDLESRIQTAEASVERLKGFLSEATDIEAIAELEAQLLDRETQLETLRGQLRTLQDRVDLATIFLTLTEALANPQLDFDLTAYRGHGDDGASCPGDQGLAVDKGDDATICFVIRNSGDTSLTGFTLEDSVLELALDDLIVVFGDPAGTLEPGQEIVLAAEVTVERDLRTQTRVTAIPVDDEGNEIEAREVSSTQTLLLQAEDPGGVPSFSDGLSGAWSVLVTVGQVAVLVAGAVIPFLWVPLVLWLGWWWWSRRRRPRRAVVAEDVEPLA